jgi:hypothetical protein
MFSRTGKAATVYELSYFVSKSHLKIEFIPSMRALSLVC